MSASIVAIFGAAGLVLGSAWARTAAAQGTTTPPDETAATAAQDAADDEAPAAARPPRWAASVRLQQARDTNPALREGDEDRGSWVTSLRAGAVRSFEARRGRHSVSAEAELERYHELRGLDQVRWSAAGSSEIRLSLRSRLDLEGSVTSTRARDLQTFLDSGLLLPASPVRRVAGAAGLSRRLSAAMTASAWGRYQRVTFDSEDLADGSEGAVGATLGRRLGQRHTLSFSYGLRRTASGEQADSFHAASLAWRGSLGRRVKADAMAGGVYRTAEGTERPFDLEAGAGLEYRARSVGFDVRYSRSVGQAFGFSAPHLSDVGAFRAGWRPTAAVSLEVSSSYGWIREPLRRAFDYRSRTHVADLHWSPTRALTLSTGYSYLRRVPSDGRVASTDHVWKTSLSVGRSWP